MRRILNYPGSKWTMANWIVSLMPPHKTYLEPFFGSGAVFFNKPRSYVETLNDIDSRIVNFFEVCRDQPEELMRVVNLTPLSREEYENSYEVSPDPVEDARRTLVRSWQAIGGETSDRTGWRSLIEPNGKTAAEWGNLSGRIIEVARRLKNAQIEHQVAITLLERYSRPNVLTYVDPPYLLSTRSKRHYAHEYTDADHEALLDTLMDFKGNVILSGYESDMYNRMLHGWDKAHFEVSVETGGRAVETIWTNFPIPDQIRETWQLDLFQEVPHEAK